MKKVRFIRLSVQREESVTAHLQALLQEGWRVVSHAENDGEYSFVLEREI